MDEMNLSTIAEEDGDGASGGSTTAKPNETPLPTIAASSKGDDDRAGSKEIMTKKEKKKKKKKTKSSADADFDYDAVQQILIDTCKGMKDLEESIREGQTKSSENIIESNRRVVSRLENRMGMLQENLKHLDNAIESKATPEQIDDLVRIRAVQKIIKSVTDDNDKTVAIYEEHVRRGTAEIERLRQDLLCERREVVALRSELETLRGERQRMSTSATSAVKPVNNICINADESVGGNSDLESAATGHQQPYAKYINGIMPNGGGSIIRRGSSLLGGELFDDMTLETKGSYETVAYEMKSLKKRIIHMKKKLSVAQLEAKETGGLRVEVERLRVNCETEKMAAQSKDETIQRLEVQIQELLRLSAAAESASSTTSPPVVVTVSTKSPKKTKWWDIRDASS
jgi:ABC-type phosphate transport system auxiliary subunit